MNYKIQLTYFFIIQSISFIFIFLLFNIINKSNYIFTTLQVKKIKSWNEFQQPSDCQIILNWKKKNLSAQEAVKKIEKITSLDQTTEININKNPLNWENKNEIIIKNFNNKCKWWIKTVVVKTKDTTLWEDLMQKILQT